LHSPDDILVHKGADHALPHEHVVCLGVMEINSGDQYGQTPWIARAYPPGAHPARRYPHAAARPITEPVTKEIAMTSPHILSATLGRQNAESSITYETELAE
jgi:hypothetical protein